MPRPNQRRAVDHEEQLAKRIQYEREARGWTYDGLAQRMTDAGCAIQGSAIYKIENGKPRRRITFDEAVTFAVVFGVKLKDLAIPAAVAASREAVKLYEEWERTSQEYLRLSGRLHDIEARLVELVDGDEAVLESLLSEGGDDAGALISNARWFVENADRFSFTRNKEA